MRGRYVASRGLGTGGSVSWEKMDPDRKAQALLEKDPELPRQAKLRPGKKTRNTYHRGPGHPFKFWERMMRHLQP
jgi:hypothetical protein